MLGTLNDSTILRLRVKGSDLDPLALRGRLENVLSEVSLQPRLPPSATLFIRKLNDPLPGSIQLDSPHARAPHAWRHAFQTRFNQLVSSAARPAHGFVADSAESVVFYDYAELLASLTADWCSGFAATRWWWQALLKRADVSKVIRQLWREKIEYVPVALEYLVKKNAIVEFVSRLSDDEAGELVERVVQVFGVTRIAQIKAADFFSLDEAPPLIEKAQAPKPLMPWRHVVPESDTPRFTPVQQLFVGITLMVQRAPVRVRTLSFAHEVEHWIQEHVVVVPREREIVVNEISEGEFVNPPETVTPISADPIAAPPVIVRSDPPPEGSVRSTVKIANAVFNYDDPVVTPEQPFMIANEQPLVHNEHPVPVRVPVEPAPPPEPLATSPSPVLLDTFTIETELGGLFYLINLAIFMEIYNDFTSPVERFHDDLSIWDFVLIVADDINQHQDLDDPIWTGLQGLQDLQEEDPVPTPAWLADLLPELKDRLLLALGLNDHGTLPDLLLHHHAKVIITPTHLDVFFSLNDHPIEIRLSGLDRNPGWVPAAGRFIAFHYD